MADLDRASIIHTDGAHVEPARDVHRWSIRVRPADRAALEKLVGVSLPAQPLRACDSQEAAALWLGPDEHLVLMPPDHAAAFRERGAQLDWASAPPCSLVEITDRNAGFVLTGAWVPWILSAGCPLDLTSSAFPPDSCTRTVFHRAEIVLWRRSTTAFRYHVECGRSYAPYLWRHLARSAAECTAEHGTRAAAWVRR